MLNSLTVFYFYEQTSMTELIRAIGLMSGSSGDGVDAALLETDGANEIRFLGGLTIPYESELQNRLLEAAQFDVPLVELLRVEEEISQFHARAVRELLDSHGDDSAAVSVIGFHGHTVRHIPTDGLTMQIGNPWIIERAAGVPVVCDFRRNDMAHGGKGAPLVAMFHQALFEDDPKPVVVLNLGGVANLTWLGSDGQIVAGDTGPGCGLLNEWAQEMAGLPHDQDGRLASKGKVVDAVVAAALTAGFFANPLPKAADRFDFDHVDVSGYSAEDGAATLCAITVQAIVQAVQRLDAYPDLVWVSGGGVHHPVLMEMLARHFSTVKSVSERGLSPDTLEAECFAWLAVRRLRGLPLSIPQTTGCEASVSGGVLTC